MSRDRLLPDIVPISPTGRSTWDRCRRQFLLAHLLALPISDEDTTTHHGLLAHHILAQIHTEGSCRDDDHVARVVDGYDKSTIRRLRGVIERHVTRCPPEVERDAHEVEVARFHHQPPPMYMGTARIDAVWIHDGVLDARDYKTGAPWVERVQDDPAARLQAWILARYAPRRHLRLRLRYELLAAEVTDDPEPFEPDIDELEAIEEELRVVVAAMWAEEADGRWRGIADATICCTCRYRSVCPDSAPV